MRYLQDSPLNHETIAAIATAAGPAAISVIRISGHEALEISSKIFSKNLKNIKSHTVHVGNILDKDNKILDKVLLIAMLSPKSYTGENTVEIHCHGGELITRKVYDRVLEAGARAAHPGEFTFRAFLNKKMDLVQAEAVAELISTNNEIALTAAKQQLSGFLSNEIVKIQNGLIDILALVESSLDFPEEDLSFEPSENLQEELKKIKSQIELLVKNFFDGTLLNQGINLAIIGPPNVGKSSLMNLLCHKDRAIVTPHPGTTRDTIEDKINLGSLCFNIIDTAGIRTTSDPIELEGIQRSKRAKQEAHLILLVLDASEKIDPEAENLLEGRDLEKTIVIWNKIDLKQPSYEIPHSVQISVKKNEGIEVLKQEIEKRALNRKDLSTEELILTKFRHKEALQSALGFCSNAISGLEKKLSLEFVASDIRFCLIELNKIIGIEITEDLLTSIFSKFCIGK